MKLFYKSELTTKSFQVLNTADGKLKTVLNTQPRLTQNIVKRDFHIGVP